MKDKRKENIRHRDRYQYNKTNGAIPEGYTMHHLYYSDTYDPNSFVIISEEEHCKIHGHHVESGDNTNYFVSRTEYRNRTKEYTKNYNTNYRNGKRREELLEKKRMERKETDCVLKFFNVTRKMWEKELTPEVRAFMRETYRAINNRG